MEVKIYLDASYSPQARKGVIGCLIVSDQETLIVEETEAQGSTNCELEAWKYFQPLIQQYPEAIVHTDCQKLFQLYSDTHNLVKVVGHGKTGMVDPNFKKVDKATRKYLRQIVRDK
jgi:hypothetical protein